MPNGSSSREQPSWLTLMVFLLTGGLVTQFFLPVRQQAPQASTKEKATATEEQATPTEARATPDADKKTRQTRLLSPLARYFGMPGDSRIEVFAKALAENDPQFLFVTVADPRDTVLGYRFDLQLDTLHKALSVDGFVLDHFYAPWEESAREHRWRDEPGVLLYRRPDPGDKRQTDLLLVLLIGEQPTSGIQRPAFDEALKLVAGLKPDVPPPILISGTMFTGAAPSVAQAIAAAQRDVKLGKLGNWPCYAELDVTVVSGGSLGIDLEAFEKIAEGTGANVDIAATVGSVKQLKNTLIEYVHERSLSYWLSSTVMPEFKVAWLTETVSGYGQSSRTSPGSLDLEPGTVPAHRPEDHVIEIPFPLNIAQIRASYEEARAAGQRPSAVGERYRLRLGLDDVENSRDVPRLFTPQLTSPTNELVLGQILAMIRRQGIRYVGISTSDIRDVIFLAQFIKTHYPACQLMVVTSDLIHVHPAYRQALAGTLVATSYPLLPDALRWYDSRSRREIVFSHQNYYGMFNAIRVLRELQQPTAEQSSSSVAEVASRLRDLPISYRTALIAYRSSPDRRKVGDIDCPPVWISMIGNDGNWPVWTKRYPDPGKKAECDNYVVRTRWCRARQNGVKTDPGDSSNERPQRVTAITGRFVQNTLVSYLFWLPLSTLVGLAVLRDLKTEWCNPLRLSPGAGKKLAIRPYWFLLGILVALWLSLIFLAVLAAVAIFVSGSGTPSSYVAWGSTLLLALGAVAASTIVMRAIVQIFRRRGRRGHSNGILWYHTAFVQAIALVAVCVKVIVTIVIDGGPHNLILWYNYTYEAFNGVSLALPLTLWLLAVIALCYGLLCQYYLARKHFVPRPRRQSDPPEGEEQARQARNQTKDQLLFPIIAKLHKDRHEGRVRWPINHLLVVTVIALWFAWIGWQTVVTDASPLQFAAMMLLLLVACVLWGLRLVKTIVVLRQFLLDMDGFFDKVTIPSGLKPPTRVAAWEAIFERKPARRRQELGIFFHSGRPRRDASKEREDLETTCRELQGQAATHRTDQALQNKFREACEDLYATWIEQFAEQYIAHLRTLIRWLLISGILIFLASASYPFNTAQYLRLTTSLMLGALGMAVVYAYVRLDRDPLMSLIVGSKPFEFRFDWNFIRTTAPILIIALITLLSQAFPEAWFWVSPIAEPLTRSSP